MVCSYLGTDLKNRTGSSIDCLKTEAITAGVLEQPLGVAENKIRTVTNSTES